MVLIGYGDYGRSKCSSTEHLKYLFFSFLFMFEPEFGIKICIYKDKNNLLHL